MKRALAVAALAILVLAGCSQVEALAPVGGNRPTQVRFATIDVLLTEGIELLEAPTCTMPEGREVTCSGTTVDGDDVTAVSPAADPQALEVKVGDTTIYSGTIDDVIESNIRPQS